MDLDMDNLTAITASAYDAVKDLNAGDEYKLAGFKIVLEALLGGYQPETNPRAKVIDDKTVTVGPADD